MPIAISDEIYIEINMSKKDKRTRETIRYTSKAKIQRGKNLKTPGLIISSNIKLKTQTFKPRIPRRNLILVSIALLIIVGGGISIRYI